MGVSCPEWVMLLGAGGAVRPGCVGEVKFFLETEEKVGAVPVS